MKVMDTWNHMDVVCKIYFLHGLDNILYNVYSSIKSENTLWKALDKKYKAKDVCMKKFIVSQFMDFKMVHSNTMIS
jgi:hypothetical protein